MAPKRIQQLWLGYVAVTVAVCLVRGAVPETSAAVVLISCTYPLLAIAAIAAGIRINRPARRLPWFLLMGTTAVTMLGNLVFAPSLIRGELPFPSTADAFWLACYPLELTGLMLLVHGMSWRRDRAGILDTLMVTCGLGLGVWLLLLRNVIGPTMPLGTRLLTVAYPLADLLLTAGVIRLLTSSARRSLAFWQLIASLLVQSHTHAVWVLMSAQGTNHNELAPGFVLSTMLLGGAALHPSMAAVGAGAVDRRPAATVTRRRVVLIGSAGLLSPILLILDGVFTTDQADWLAASICGIVVFLLVIARIVGLVATVQDQARQLESIAYLDALTGIANRRAWDAELARRLAVTRRAGGTLIVGLLDLDHFKRYNDLHGHPAGDELLRAASAAWQAQLRPEDLIARYGGEEFGLILHCGLRDASMIMDRLLDATPGGQTFSAGLAQWTGEETAEQLITRVDAALYTAKREGRDRFSVTGHPAHTDLNRDFLAGAARQPL